ncbi:MAG: ABC transporter ATP-binding protein [Thermoplasmata archaeon]
MKQNILEIKDLQVFYGGIKALDSISIQVKESEIVVLLGANGAGKTTTLRTISKITKAKSGSIIFNGINIEKIPAHQIVRLGISHVPEGRRVFSALTVMENLIIGAYTKKSMDKNTLDWIYGLFPRLYERRKQLAGTLSGGEQQMLAIGRALISTPKLLLLDEPSLGLSPLLTKTIFNAIKDIRNNGITILMVEQNARASLQFADEGYILEAGKIVLHDKASNLLLSEKVIEAYLGKK